MSGVVRMLDPDEVAARPTPPKLSDVGALHKRLAGAVEQMAAGNDAMAMYSHAGELMPDEIRIAAACLGEYLVAHGDEEPEQSAEAVNLADQGPRATRGRFRSIAHLALRKGMTREEIVDLDARMAAQAAEGMTDDEILKAAGAK